VYCSAKPLDFFWRERVDGDFPAPDPAELEAFERVLLDEAIF
jgi:hypothetical protein